MSFHTHIDVQPLNYKLSLFRNLNSVSYYFEHNSNNWGSNNGKPTVSEELLQLNGKLKNTKTNSVRKITIEGTK